MRHNDTTSGGQLVKKINTPTPYYCCCIHNASTYIIYWKVTNVKLVLRLHFATWTTKISALFFWGVKRSNVYTQVKSCAITMTYCHGVQQRLSHRRKNLCSHLPLRYSCSALATLCSTVADNDDDDKRNNWSSTNFCKLYAPTFNSSAHNYLLTTIHNVIKSWQCVN